MPNLSFSRSTDQSSDIILTPVQKIVMSLVDYGTAISMIPMISKQVLIRRLDPYSANPFPGYLVDAYFVFSLVLNQEPAVLL